MKTKLIDPIDIKQAVKNKQLKIYIGEDRSNHKKYIYCADIISVNKYGVEELGDTVKLCEIKEPKSCMYFYEDMDWCSMLGKHV